MNNYKFIKNVPFRELCNKYMKYKEGRINKEGIRDISKNYTYKISDIDITISESGYRTLVTGYNRMYRIITNAEFAKQIWLNTNNKNIKIPYYISYINNFSQMIKFDENISMKNLSDGIYQDNEYIPEDGLAEFSKLDDDHMSALEMFGHHMFGYHNL